MLVVRSPQVRADPRGAADRPRPAEARP